MAITDHLQGITQIPQLHVAQHKEPPLLQLIHKEDELTGRSRVGHHQQHLRPPELHVVLPHIQHQQILSHLKTKQQTVPLTNRRSDLYDCVSAGYLMENQSLADVAPAAGG